MVVFVSPGIYPEIYSEVCPEICSAKKIKNIYIIFMVSRNFRQTHLLEVGLTQIPVDHAPLSIVRHVGLHVDFSSMNFLLGL